MGKEGEERKEEKSVIRAGTSHRKGTTLPRAVRFANSPMRQTKKIQENKHDFLIKQEKEKKRCAECGNYKNWIRG
jgi:hypothetical protein